MAPLYRIKDWESVFENATTRKLKSLLWVPIPTRQDGDGYTAVVNHPNGAAHYGVFVALVCIASRCTPRGDLVRGNGEPHTAASLARICRMSEAVVGEAINHLSCQQIGWLVVESANALGEKPDALAPSRASAVGRKEGSEGRKETTTAPDAPALGDAEVAEGGSEVETKSREGDGRAAGERRASEPRGTRIPEDFTLTDDLRRVAREEGIPDSDVERLFRGFVGYWLTVPGVKGRKLDWRQTWRNRCIDQAPRYASARSHAVGKPTRQLRNDLADFGPGNGGSDGTDR